MPVELACDHRHRCVIDDRLFGGPLAEA